MRVPSLQNVLEGADIRGFPWINVGDYVGNDSDLGNAGAIGLHVRVAIDRHRRHGLGGSTVMLPVAALGQCTPDCRSGVFAFNRHLSLSRFLIHGSIRTADSFWFFVPDEKIRGMKSAR